MKEICLVYVRPEEGCFFMDIVFAITLGIMVILWFVAFLNVYYKNKESNKYTNITRFLVRVAVFGAISTLLYVVPVLKFPVPFFPQFLEFHFDEIPAFIAGFAYGPLSALGVLFIKTIIKLPFSSTLCVGELSDFIYSVAFILPAAFIYKHNRKFKGAMSGLLIGTFTQLVVSTLSNIYLMIPFYMFMYNMDESQLLYLCQLANPNIDNIGWAYGLMAVLPFNAIKDIVVVIITMIVYKSTHKFIDKLQA